MIRTMSGAQRRLAEAMADATADFPDTPEVDLSYEMVRVVAAECVEAVGRELCRCEGVTYPARPAPPSAAELAAKAEAARVAALPSLTPQQEQRLAERRARRRQEAATGCTR